MRLIDADELRKCAIPCQIHNGALTDLCVPLYQIDNAPTVFDCRSCKNNGNERYCLDCHDYCNFVRYEARPQGKWIEKKNENLGKCLRHLIECSVCGSAFCYEDLLRRSYCPNCGADMRGGAE